jgi:hypothetical protein
MFIDAFIQIHRNCGQIITYSYYLFSSILIVWIFHSVFELSNSKKEKEK